MKPNRTFAREAIFLLLVGEWLTCFEVQQVVFDSDFDLTQTDCECPQCLHPFAACSSRDSRFAASMTYSGGLTLCFSAQASFC